MKKKVIFDKRAEREIDEFPVIVQEKIAAYLLILKRDGFLAKPYAKVLTSDLLEIRVKYKGGYRVIYAYLINDLVIVLSAFQKKSNKTPLKELKKAKKRYKEHLLVYKNKKEGGR